MSKVVLIYWPKERRASGVGLTGSHTHAYARVVRLSRRTAVASSRCSRCSVRRVTEPPSRASTVSAPVATRPSRPRAQPAAAKAIKVEKAIRKVRRKARTPTGSTGGGRRSYGSGPSRVRRPVGAARRSSVGRTTGSRPRRPIPPPLRLRPDDPVLRQGPAAVPSCDLPAMAFRASSDGGADVRSGPVPPAEHPGRAVRPAARDGRRRRRPRELDGREVADHVLEVDRSWADVVSRSGRVPRSRLGRSSVAGRQSRTACTSTSASTTLRAGWRSRTTEVRRGCPRQQVSTERPLLLRERHGGDGRRERGDLDRELRVAVLDGRAPGAASRSRSSGPPTGARRSTRRSSTPWSSLVAV